MTAVQQPDCDPYCMAPFGSHHPRCTAADVTREPTGGQGLREAVARHLHGLHNPDRFWRAEWADHTQDFAAADAVLALPELAALIADAERVRRVRESIHDFDAFQDAASRAMAMWRIRRALDGEPQP